MRADRVFGATEGEKYETTHLFAVKRQDAE